MGQRLDGRFRAARVHGRPEVLKTVRQHLFSELLFPVEPPFDMQAILQHSKLAGGGRLTHFPLKHPGGSIGMRLEMKSSRLTASLCSRTKSKLLVEPM